MLTSFLSLSFDQTCYDERHPGKYYRLAYEAPLTRSSAELEVANRELESLNFTGVSNGTLYQVQGNGDREILECLLVCRFYALACSSTLYCARLFLLHKIPYVFAFLYVLGCRAVCFQFHQVFPVRLTRSRLGFLYLLYPCAVSHAGNGFTRGH